KAHAGAVIKSVRAHMDGHVLEVVTRWWIRQKGRRIVVVGRRRLSTHGMVARLMCFTLRHARKGRQSCGPTPRSSVAFTTLRFLPLGAFEAESGRWRKKSGGAPKNKNMAGGILPYESSRFVGQGPRRMAWLRLAKNRTASDVQYTSVSRPLGPRAVLR